jgi:putative ABC transport system substrate-binding protein
MDRRRFLGSLAGLIAAPLAAEAHVAGRVPKIGYLGSGSAGASRGLVEAFTQGMREHGYIDGLNIAIEWRFAEGRFERLPALAAELVRLKVDLIFAVNPETVAPTRNVTKVIPIVFAAGDPIASGFVASLARPGGNITGLSTSAPGFEAKRVELLKEVIPKMSRVAVLSNPANPGHPAVLKEMDVAARTLKVKVQRLDVRNPSDLKSALQAATQGRAEGLIALDDSFANLFCAQTTELFGLPRVRVPQRAQKRQDVFDRLLAFDRDEQLPAARHEIEKPTFTIERLPRILRCFHSPTCRCLRTDGLSDGGLKREAAALQRGEDFGRNRARHRGQSASPDPMPKGKR